MKQAIHNMIISPTVEEALAEFYGKNNLPPDGGVNDRWVKLNFGKFHIPFPNTPARKKAIVFHDIHHLLTGYNNNWKGEATIGAWEISSGCGSYRAAWIFNLGIFATGVFLFPRAVFKAFVRGRRTLNFYHGKYTHPQILQMPVDDARAKLRLNMLQNEPANNNEILAFIIWWLIAFAVSVIVFIAPVAVPIALIVNHT